MRGTTWQGGTGGAQASGASAFASMRGAVAESHRPHSDSVLALRRANDSFIDGSTGAAFESFVGGGGRSLAMAPPSSLKPFCPGRRTTASSSRLPVGAGRGPVPGAFRSSPRPLVWPPLSSITPPPPPPPQEQNPPPPPAPPPLAAD